MTKTLKNKLLVALLAVLVCITGFLGVSLGMQARTAYAAGAPVSDIHYSVVECPDGETRLYLGSKAHTLADGENQLTSSTISGANSAAFNGETGQAWRDYRSNITEVVIETPIAARYRMQYFFYGLSNCDSYVGLENFDFEQTTNFTRWFEYSGAKSLDLTSWNMTYTDRRYDLLEMFGDCSNLEYLDLSTWTTPRIYWADGMFYNCTNLKYLDISSLCLDDLYIEGAYDIFTFHEDTDKGLPKLEVLKISQSVANKIADGTITVSTLPQSWVDSDGNTIAVSDITTAGTYIVAGHVCSGPWDDNGFCICGNGYEPATLVSAETDKNPVYEIANGGQMFWFAGLVNGTLDGVTQVSKVDAYLAADIDLENRVWTAIGNAPESTDTGDKSCVWQGHFDGKGKTISNLNIQANVNNSALFGVIYSSTVENFTLRGNITVNVSNASGVASVAGYVGQSTISGVSSYVDIAFSETAANNSVSINEQAYTQYIGGIAGKISYTGTSGYAGTISNCAYYGTIDLGDRYIDLVGGILAYIYPGSNNNIKATISDCAFYGEIINAYQDDFVDSSDTKIGVSIGGMLGFTSFTQLSMTDCLSVGTFDVDGMTTPDYVTAFGNYGSAVTSFSGFTGLYYLEGSGVSNGYVSHSSGAAGIYAVSAETLASGEVTYLLNNSAQGGTPWRQSLATSGDVYPLLTTSTDENGVYTYTYCNGEARYTNEASLADTTVEHKFTDDSNGFCTNEGCANGYMPAVYNEETGYWEISNGGQMFWFAQQVNEEGMSSYNGMLMNDIDLEKDNRIWIPVGTDTNCYAGTFDGNYKRIKNMRTNENEDCQGFFGVIGDRSQSGVVATIREVIIDSSCEVVGTQHIAGVVGATMQDIDGTILIENCGNEANVTATAAEQTNAAGILGCVRGYNTISTIRNCYNSGNISGPRECAAIAAWVSYSGSIENCLNVGTVTGIDTTTSKGGFFVRYQSGWTSTVSNKNNYSLTHSQSYITSVTNDQLTSGEVTYLLNNSLSGGEPWTQTLATDSTDGDGYPNFEGEKVYKIINGACTIEEANYYSNVNENVLTHCANGYKYAQNEENANQINVYCADCGKLLYTIQITLPEYLGYTGAAFDVSGFGYKIVETYVAGYEAELPVEYTFEYKASEGEEYAEVSEVKESGFYRVTMTVGVATFAVEPATYATASAEFEVTETRVTFEYYDFDGTFIDSEAGIIAEDGSCSDTPSGPAYTLPGNEYYTYTFKYWYCENNGVNYTTEELQALAFNAFAAGSTVSFKAVYDVEYKKQFDLQGSIDESTGLTDSVIYGEEVLIVDGDEEVVQVVTNYAITANDGIAALLLIPEYDYEKFSIAAVSVNGQNVYNPDYFNGAIPSTALFTVGTTDGYDGAWTVTASNGTDFTSENPFKLLMEGLPASDAWSENGEIFIQIVYTMNTVATGEYEFGFVTQYQDITTDEEPSHGDRSEAYGVLLESAVAGFNELKITVENASVVIVERTTAEIVMKKDSVVYDGAAAGIEEDCVAALDETLTNEFLYHYSGYDVTLIDGVATIEGFDWSQFITITWATDDGLAPTEVGEYQVTVSAAENDYFKAVSATFDVTITPYTIEVEIGSAKDKIYNGSEQTWTTDDVTIKDVIETYNDEKGYDVAITNATYTNANVNDDGTVSTGNEYVITLTFTATGNYTFADGTEITLEYQVKMNQYKLIIIANNQTVEYGVPNAQWPGLTYSPVDNNGVDIDGDGTGDIGIQGVLADTKADDDGNQRLKIVLDKETGNDAGTYDITVTATEADGLNNYDITYVHNQDETVENGDNGTYTITRKVIEIPTIDDLTYNGTEQFPVVVEDYVEVYTYTGDKQENVGNYTLTATLKARDDGLSNYVWADYVGNDEDNLVYENIEWKIVAKKITVTIDGLTEAYGTTLAENVIGKIVYSVADEDGTVGGLGEVYYDEFKDIVTLTIDGTADGYGFYPVNTYAINYAANNTNYAVTFQSVGDYVVEKAVIEVTAEDIAALIKEYTGNEVTWAYDNEADFTLSDRAVTAVTSNGAALTIADIIKLVGAEKQGEYIAANGWLDGETFTYWDPETKYYYYTLTVELNDGFGGNFELKNTTVDSEVRIKQAKNDWTVAPHVENANIADFAVTTGTPIFKAENEVTVTLYQIIDNVATELTYSDTWQPVKGYKYKLVFTVAQTNNYTGLEKEIMFELEGFSTVDLPIVYLDSIADENKVPVNDQKVIVYDGVAHAFVFDPSNSEGKYTIIVNTGDNYASWKNAGGEYYITVVLNPNYCWTGGDTDTDDKIYTLVINKASLTITATSDAENNTITYLDPVPTYSALASEETGKTFVGGETLATYGVDQAWLNGFVTGEYAENDPVNEYDITFITDAEAGIEEILRNYDVTLVDNTLIVKQLVIDLTDVGVTIDGTTDTTWVNVTAEDLTFEYNAKAHAIVVSTSDENLKYVTISLVFAPTEALTDGAAINAGTYTISLISKFNAEYENASANFDVKLPENDLTMEITKVEITVTVKDQEVYYQGENVYVNLNTTAASEATLSLTDGRDITQTEFDFIRVAPTGVIINGVKLDQEGYYWDVNDYSRAIIADLSYNENNYLIHWYGESEDDGTLSIVKKELGWKIELTTVGREYNGSALAVGNADNYADYFAQVNDGAKEGYEISYKFYQSNVDGEEALTYVPVNAGTYYVKAFFDDEIHVALESEFVSIVISKVNVSITATAEDKFYLQEVVYGYESDTMSAATEGDDVQSVTYTFSNDGGANWVSAPVSSWFVVGDYQVKAIVNETTNYAGAESIAEFTISPAQLSGVSFDYATAGKVSWSAVTTANDTNDEIDKYGAVTVTYTLVKVTTNEGGELVYTPVADIDISGFVFTPEDIGVYAIIASVEGNANFADSTSTMEEVFSVEFKDIADNHVENQTEIYDFSTVAPVQYRFSGQVATQPYLNAEEISITGYTFANAWELDGERYGFTTGVGESITLYALWDIKEFTVYWYDGEGNILEPETYTYNSVPSFKGEEPSMATDKYYSYKFIGWNDEKFVPGVETVIDEFDPVTEDTHYYAIFKVTGTEYEVTFMLSIDGGAYAEYLKQNVAYGESLSQACSLAEVVWFRGDIWYAQAERYYKLDTMPAENITVYGSYVFDIGSGDVNADGTITTSDITLYRQWVVGGYDMNVIEEGKEWETVTAEGFSLTNEDGTSIKYFLKRVADPNADKSDDIRDITTIRMSLVGGYGYGVSAGVGTIAGVTGEAVTTLVEELEYVVVETDGDNIEVAEGDPTVITVGYKTEGTTEITIYVNNVSENYRDIQGLTPHISSSVPASVCAITDFSYGPTEGNMTQWTIWFEVSHGEEYKGGTTYEFGLDIDGSGVHYGLKWFTIVVEGDVSELIYTVRAEEGLVSTEGDTITVDPTVDTVYIDLDTYLDFGDIEIEIEIPFTADQDEEGNGYVYVDYCTDYYAAANWIEISGLYGYYWCYYGEAVTDLTVSVSFDLDGEGTKYLEQRYTIVWGETDYSKMTYTVYDIPTDEETGENEDGITVAGNIITVTWDVFTAYCAAYGDSSVISIELNLWLDNGDAVTSSSSLDGIKPAYNESDNCIDLDLSSLEAAPTDGFTFKFDLDGEGATFEEQTYTINFN